MMDAEPHGYTPRLPRGVLLTVAAQGTADCGPKAFEAVAQPLAPEAVVSELAPCAPPSDPVNAAKEGPGEIRSASNIRAKAEVQLPANDRCSTRQCSA